MMKVTDDNATLNADEKLVVWAIACTQLPEHPNTIDGKPVIGVDLAEKIYRRLSHSAVPGITEHMVEAAAQRMVALVMGHVIEKPQLVQWQQWAGSARSILEAALEQSPRREPTPPTHITARSPELQELLDRRAAERPTQSASAFTGKAMLPPCDAPGNSTYTMHTDGKWYCHGCGASELEPWCKYKKSVPPVADRCEP